MSDLPKQELDALFREGADMQKFEYNEAAWDKMEVKLDADDRNRRIGIWFLLIVGLILATMAGLWYTSLDHNNVSAEEIYASDDTATSSSNHSITNQELETTQVTQEQPSNPKNEDGQQIVSAISSTTKDTKIKPIASKISSSDNKAGLKNIEDSAVASNVVIAKNTSTKEVDNEQIIAEAKVANNLARVGDMTSENNEIIKLITIQKLNESNVAKLHFSRAAVENGLSKLDITMAESDEESDESSITNRLSFTAFAAPEWSAVGIDGSKKKGYKFGAKIGLQIADRWELSTGLSLSQKKFNGKGSQFTEAGGWIDDIMPMTMEAKCNIIEIPLDVIYHHSGVGNSGFVASAGLRSFMLHSEWYGFEYEASQYKPGLMDEKNLDNQNKNWLGSIELSAGYNQKVNKNLFVQVLPYVQIPVTGFGDGKVNLFSGGVQLAVRFDGK